MDDCTITLLVSAEQLDRYFANELPLPEAERVRAWLAANPELAECARAMRNIWAPSSWTPPDVESGWEAVTTQIRGAQGTNHLSVAQPFAPFAGGRLSSSGSRTPNASTFPRSVPSDTLRLPKQGRLWHREKIRLGLVALTCLCIGVAGAHVVWDWMRPQSQSIPDAQWKLYRTARGQHAELRLADGTKVTLAPESRLQVRQDGPLADREVDLSGRAFFVVTPHPRRPFIVRTQHGVTEELGTSFSVTAYPDDSVTRVVVADGRVALWSNTQQKDIRTRTVRVLEAGEFATISSQGVSERIGKADLTQELRWRNRELFFQSASLGAIMTALERWYDVRVTYQDSTVRHLILTVTVTDDPIDETLRVITRSLNLRFERRGNVVHILGTYH